MGQPAIFSTRILHDADWDISFVRGANPRPDAGERYIQIPIEPSLYDELSMDRGIARPLRSLLGVAAASILLCRLGWPRREDDVTVSLEGGLASSVLRLAEQLLALFVRGREFVASTTQAPPACGRVRFEQVFGELPARIPPLRKRGILLALSGGLDSAAVLRFLLQSGQPVRTLFFKFLSRGGELKPELRWERRAIAELRTYLSSGHSMVDHEEVLLDISDFQRAPLLTRRESADHDFWGFHGRYLLMAVVMAFICCKYRLPFFANGFTEEGVLPSDLWLTTGDYNCCESALTAATVDLILSKALGNYAPRPYVPLATMGKGSVTRYVMRDPSYLGLTRSCVGDSEVEDASCFSCFDKLASLLAACYPNRLGVQRTGSFANMEYNGEFIGTWRWSFRRRESLNSEDALRFPEMASRQLERLASDPGRTSFDLDESVFSPISALAAVWNLRRQNETIEALRLGPAFSWAEAVATKKGNRWVSRLVAPYSRDCEPMSLSSYVPWLRRWETSLVRGLQQTGG